MIPFASQRAGGQDLATHLMNAHDNEQIELFHVRGAIAHDLHGAFAEWEAIAKALTRCRQYLCSLSINPDERQGRLTRQQYLDYIERAETALDLAGQPRAIIFHVKQGEDGRAREHCHVVWSRIDLAQGKAVPLSFFKEKMMTVTRDFARDHGLALPSGYDRQEDELRRRNRQLTGYDGIKQKETGISHEERMAAVTDAWRRSDSGRAFVNALADLGYILAQGRNKTRVVLVDSCGHTTALTRLIDDASVRAKHVRDFLGAEYAPESLPSVEDAQALAAQRRKLIEAFEKARAESEQVAALVRAQAERRQALEEEASALRQRQHEDRGQLAAVHKTARQKLKSAYLAAQKGIRRRRAQRRPTGLAAFLGRVTGMALITRKVQRYRDRKRYGAYLVLREALKRRQQDERDALARRHELQGADLRRRLRALDKIEKRERQTLDTAALKDRRQRINARHDHMPSMTPAFRLRAGTDGPEAGHRHEFSLSQELARAVGQPTPDRQVRLPEAFGRVSGSSEGDQDGRGESGGLQPDADDRPPVPRRRRKRLTADFARAVDDQQGDGEAGGSSSDDLKPAAESKVARRRRQKERPSRRARDSKSERLRAFNEAARGGEDEGSQDSATEAPAPAAETKIRGRRRRRRDLDREFNSVSGAGDGRTDDRDSGDGPRRRRRSRGQDPPEGGGPPQPRRRRKRDFGREM